MYQSSLVTGSPTWIHCW